MGVMFVNLIFKEPPEEKSHVLISEDVPASLRLPFRETDRPGNVYRK